MPKPESVYVFMDKFFREHGVNPGRSSYELSVETEAMIVQTRRMLGEFFGYRGDPSRVTFSMNATDSMNTALLGLVQPADHIVITNLEHNAVLRPVNHLERDQNVEVTRIAADKNGYIRMPNVNMVEEMVDIITASRAYEANVTMMTAIKNMAKKAMEI